MIEVFDNIYVGDDSDYERESRNHNFAYLHCAKFPYHRNLVGYDEKINPTHEEYLFAHRNMVLSLNMVDSKEPKYFSVVQFQYAMLFIKGEIAKGYKVLINCNKGQSRSPSVALVYLAQLGVVRNDSFSEAKSDFIKIYPNYQPNLGVASFLLLNWKRLVENINIKK